MIPTPADIAYFIEIARTLNLSRAAERLGISQPSLTLAVQRLEREMGAPLLLRSRRGVSLTPAGKQLVSHAEQLLQSWQGVKAGALASMNEVRGSYTIGCHPSVALYLLSGFLPALLEKHNDLNIRLKHDLSRKIAEGVISFDIDIGVVVNPVRHPDLVLHRLCRDEVTLWTGPGKNPLQDIAGGMAVLICDPDLLQSQSLLRQLEKRKIAFARTIPSGNLEVIADLVAGGCGIGILPAKVATRAKRELKPVPSAPVFYDEHCLIYRAEKKGVKSIQALGAAIRAAFEI